MSPDKLVRMANQIALFFQSQDTATAPAMVADHLRKFWDPRMRKAFIAHAAAGGAGLDPVTAAAVPLLTEGGAKA
jgi:formate dehydrogenase subunit delta